MSVCLSVCFRTVEHTRRPSAGAVPPIGSEHAHVRAGFCFRFLSLVLLYCATILSVSGFFSREQQRESRSLYRSLYAIHISYLLQSRTCPEFFSRHFGASCSLNTDLYCSGVGVRQAPLLCVTCIGRACTRCHSVTLLADIPTSRRRIRTLCRIAAPSPRSLAHAALTVR